MVGGTGFRPPVGGRCRPEVGVPSRPRAFSRVAVRRFPSWRCTSERAADCPARKKNKWRRTGGSLPAISGESVKGGYPLSQKQQRPLGTRRRAPPAARKGVASAGAKRRAVRKGGSLPNTLTTNHPRESGAPLPDRSTLCRPEVGVPSRPRACFWSAVRGLAALSGKGGVLPSEGKNKWRRTGGSLPAISGESVKVGYPLSQKQQRPLATRRRAPSAARKGVASAGAKRRAVRKGGSLPNTLTTKHPRESGAPFPDRSTLRGSAIQAVPALFLGQRDVVSRPSRERAA